MRTVGNTSDGHKFEDNLGKATITFDSANSLQPNEFKVFQVYDKVYNFDTGLSTYPTGGAVYLGSEDGDKIDPVSCGYLSEWNGSRVDRPGAGTLDGARGDGSDNYADLNYNGLERAYITLTTPNSTANPSWKGTMPGLRYDTLNETVYNLGDPRSGYYIAKIQANSKYAKSAASSTDSDGNSAWWGRLYQKYLVADSGLWFAAETLVSNWPDGDHTTEHGLLPLNTTVDPMTVSGTRPSTESSKAPLSISNSGSYASIAELGHIFDPIQWRPSAFDTKPTSSAAVAAAWRDSWKYRYGEGSQLRGRLHASHWLAGVQTIRHRQ